MKSGAASGPGTYEIGGEQYVTITSGWGSAYGLVVGLDLDNAAPSLGKVVTFKLGGTGTIPEPDAVAIERKPASDIFGDAAMLDAGRVHFARNCMVCHGSLAISSGILPDLRWSAISGNAQTWDAIVRGGTLADNGMVSFADYLSEDDSEAIRAYVTARAHETLANEAALAGEE